MAQMKTVRIKSAGGFATINEVDFDSKVHVLFDAAAKPAAPPAAKPEEKAVTPVEETPKAKR